MRIKIRICQVRRIRRIRVLKIARAADMRVITALSTYLNFASNTKKAHDVIICC